MEKLLTARNTAALLALIFLWRLYLSASLQLHPDEAYYWMWSRKLDIGYFDHPPMVAYWIWLGTLVAKSEAWVRLGATLLMPALSGLMWWLSMQLFRSHLVAAGSVLLFNLLPLSMLGTVVITPDIPLLLFWSLGVCLFWRIVHSGQAWLWYPLGLCFGLALLSKYTAILMPACFLLYLLLSEDRRWLRTVHPYLSTLIGLLCFLPVVVWNSRNGWVSFAHQLNNGLGGTQPSLAQVAEYLAGQVLLVGPVFWLTGLLAALAALRQRDRPGLLLVCASLPVILFFALSSLIKVAGANWPAFAYFAFSILATRFCLDSPLRWRRWLWLGCCALSLALALVATLQARFGVLALGRYAPALAAADATNSFHGWRELGQVLQQQAPRSQVVAASHQLGATILYYTGGALPTTTTRSARPSQFNLMAAPGSQVSKPRIYVWTAADLPALDAQQLAALSTFKTYRHGHELRRYHIANGTSGYFTPALGDKGGAAGAAGPPQGE